jgi:ankyrin repeat protein
MSHLSHSVPEASSLNFRRCDVVRSLTRLCSFGDTVLHMAAFKNNAEMCELLLDQGANVNEMNEL